MPGISPGEAPAKRSRASAARQLEEAVRLVGVRGHLGHQLARPDPDRAAQPGALVHRGLDPAGGRPVAVEPGEVQVGLVEPHHLDAAPPGRAAPPSPRASARGSARSRAATNTACGHSRRARSAGVAEKTPKRARLVAGGGDHRARPAAGHHHRLARAAPGAAGARRSRRRRPCRRGRRRGAGRLAPLTQRSQRPRRRGLPAQPLHNLGGAQGLSKTGTPEREHALFGLRLVARRAQAAGRDDDDAAGHNCPAPVPVSVRSGPDAAPGGDAVSGLRPSRCANGACRAPVAQPPTGRRRLYCSDGCKQASYRKRTTPTRLGSCTRWMDRDGADLGRPRLVRGQRPCQRPRAGRDAIHDHLPNLLGTSVGRGAGPGRIFAPFHVRVGGFEKDGEALPGSPRRPSRR